MDNYPCKVYSETCAMLRHYSNASFLVRSAAVVQGIALLVPWVAAFTQGAPDVLLLYAIPVAGLIFSVLLYRFHMSYYGAAEFFYKAAAKIEQKYFDKECQPVSAYDAKHEDCYASGLKRFFTLQAPFTLTALLFACALLITVVRQHAASEQSPIKQEKATTPSGGSTAAIVVPHINTSNRMTSLPNRNAPAVLNMPTPASSSRVDRSTGGNTISNQP